jgi:hypothetical protein
VPPPIQNQKAVGFFAEAGVEARAKVVFSTTPESTPFDL